jgi:hypothetical protein
MSYLGQEPTAQSSVTHSMSAFGWIQAPLLWNAGLDTPMAGADMNAVAMSRMVFAIILAYGCLHLSLLPGIQTSTHLIREDVDARY